MFKPTDWHIAKLNYSDFYKKAYYNTNLSMQLTNDHGERLSMTDPTRERREDTPNARLYLETAYEELPQYAYICLNPSWKKSRRMTEEQFKTLTTAKASKATKKATVTQISD